MAVPFDLPPLLRRIGSLVVIGHIGKLLILVYIGENGHGKVIGRVFLLDRLVQDLGKVAVPLIAADRPFDKGGLEIPCTQFRIPDGYAEAVPPVASVPVSYLV